MSKSCRDCVRFSECEKGGAKAMSYCCKIINGRKCMVIDFDNWQRLAADCELYLESKSEDDDIPF